MIRIGRTSWGSKGGGALILRGIGARLSCEDTVRPAALGVVDAA
jgi:hypothetical protein